MSWMTKSTGLLGGVSFALAACTTPSPPSPQTIPERSVQQDRGKEFGKKFLLEARKQYRFVKDQEVVDAINTVGRRIITAAGRDPEGFHFFVVKEIQPNAFAIPGGYIFIFDGLLTKLSTEDELAGVLAHEIAHVTHNHFFKDEQKVAAMDLATIAAILLSRGQGAVASIAMATDISVQLQFSRENEQEADASAIQYLQQAGYDPRGLFNFLQGLAGYETINRVEMPAYLSTHPALQDRIHLVELRMDRPVDGLLPTPRKVLDWGRVLIMTRAKSQAWQDAPQLFSAYPHGTPPEERYHYLSALAYLTTDRVSQAVAEYQAALSASPRNPVYHADLALAYLKSQDVERARAEALESLRQSKPGEGLPSAHLVLGMLKEHDGHWDEALQQYGEVIERNPDHAFAHYHTGQVYFQKGKSLEGAYHTARYLRLNLEPEAALREFRRAKGLAPKRGDLTRKIQEEIVQLVADGI